MFTSILTAIAAIPTLISSIQELLAYFKKAEDNKWFQQSSAAFTPLEQGPTTGDQKDASAKAISDLISGS